MAQEQSFQVLAGQRNEPNHVYNTSVPVAVFPVVISDAGDILQHGQMSLQANGTKEQTSVKRKRGRPRKTRPEEGDGRAQQGHSAPPDDQLASTNQGSSRAKKTEQVGTTKSSIDNQGAVALPDSGGTVKRRGRPRRAKTQQTDEGNSSAPVKAGSIQATTVGGTVGCASIAICSAVQDAGIVSGFPIQALPTTSVANVNTGTIDNSPLKRPTTVNIVVPSSAENVSEPAARTSPSSSSVIKTFMGDQTPTGMRLLKSRLQGMTTPPLLHAEQPRTLSLLPQCVVTNSVVNVSRVDRWKEDGSTPGEASNRVPKRKQPAGDEEDGGERRSSTKNVVGSEPVRRRKREPVKKPEAHPQEQAHVKRKRGRPPKPKDSTHPVSDESPSTARETPKKEQISSADQPETETKPKSESQSIGLTTQVTEPVVKRKRGRPPKNKSQDQTTESPPPASRQPNELVGDPTSTASGEEGDKENIAKRGRTDKSCIKTPEPTRKLPVKRKRGRPRKYPIPVVAASGPFLPSVSGITLPNDESEDTPTVGDTSSQTNGQEVSIESAAVKPGKTKRGRPPRKPEDEEGPPVKRRPGRPRKNPLPAEKDGTTPLPKQPQKQAPPKQPQKQTSPKRLRKQASPKQPQKQEKEQQQQMRRKPGRPRKDPLKSSPEVIQKKIKSPVMETTEKKTAADPVPKRKQGRPKKIQPAVSTLQDPGLSSADESSVSANMADKSEDDSSEVEKLTLQISFSDSDSEHSEKLEVQTSTIMALANRVAPTPSPPRQADSPLLDPSFEESYDEDSDPEGK